MSRTRVLTWLVLIVMLLSSSAFTAAQTEATAGGVEVMADELEYQADERLIIGRGNVVVTYGPDVLSADYMTLRTDTQEARAEGNVVLTRGEAVWRGDEITYNFKTRQGEFGEFRAFSDPYFIKAEESQQVGANEFVLKNAVITTCEGERPEFYIRAREARVENEDRVTARGVVFVLHGVPVFYVPYWVRNMQGDATNIDVVPGYSSRKGAFLLTAYNYRINRVLWGATRLDYRTRRGFGVGQDFRWGSSDPAYNGLLTFYYADDDEPLAGRNDAETEELRDLVSSERYRVRLSDVRSVSERDTFIAEVNYLSDPAVLRDFFDDEYRHNVQPENRLTLTHQGDQYTAGLELNMRLNDFYENVNRLPEATFVVPRLRIVDTPLYYESQNSAAQLERVFPEGSEREDYDSFRLYSEHTLFYPTRHFGFLNLMPRAGYSATYYSSTFEENTVTNLVAGVDTNGAPTVTTETVTDIIDAGSGLRNVLELGVESSFKAFGVLTEDWIGRDDRGLRHIVEPYVRHTYIPEPNLVPAELPQFDEIDQIDKRHDVTLGVRNKFQTRRRNRVHDLVDVDVFTRYRIERREEEEQFSDVFFDVRLRLIDSLSVDFDGAYDAYESSVREFNTQLAYWFRDESRLGVEYRYREDQRDQIAAELSLWPNRRWSLSSYVRYAMDRNELEEHSYFVEHRGRCLGYGLGYKQTEDDGQFWVRLWVLAFPGSTIQLGR